MGLGRSGAADETRCDDQRLVDGKWVAGERMSAVGFSTRARLAAQSADRRATPRSARPRRRRDAMTRAPGLMSLLLVASLTQRGLAGQAVDSAVPERGAARQWYRDAKFGMFIHWGVYSLLSQGEWVMQNREIAVRPYEWRASPCEPAKFDARAGGAHARSEAMSY